MFGRKNGSDAITKVQIEIDALVQRRARLHADLETAESKLATMLLERRKQLVESDADHSLTGRDEVTHLRDRADELRDAVVEIDARLADAQGRIQAEHDRIQRKAEAERRIRDADRIQTAVVEFETAAHQLSEALSTITSVEPRCEHVRNVIARMANDIYGSVNEAIAVTRGYATNVLAGAPMLQQPITVEPPKTVPIARHNVLLLVPGKWSEGDEIKTAGPLLTIALPVAIAERALANGHAVEVDSAKAKQALSFDSPGYGFYGADRDDVLDLTLPAPKREPRSSGVMHSAVDLGTGQVAIR